jgi:hypothetical protein
MPERELLDGGDYATANHTHNTDYLPLPGGSVNGNIICVQRRAVTDITYPTEFQMAFRWVGNAQWAAKPHAHTDYASIAHTHDDYAVIGHAHDDDYAPIAQTHEVYATTGHTHDDFLPLACGFVDGMNITCVQIRVVPSGNTYSSEFRLVSRRVGDARWSARPHTHTEYADVNHVHDDNAPIAHTQDA